MNAPDRRSGFTLLETLVAAVLFGFLATLLLSFFNAGELAWRTGEAACAETTQRRQQLSEGARTAAATLPNLRTGEGLVAVRLLSPWDEDGEVRTTRPFVRSTLVQPATGTSFVPIHLAGSATHAVTRRVAVVSSAGPDGKWGTEDDLSSLPEEVWE